MGDPKPDPLHFGRDPLSLLGFNHEVINIFVLSHTVHHRAQRDCLWGGKVVIGLNFLRFRIGPHAEGAQFADAGGRAKAKVMEPKWAVGSKLELGLHLVVIDLFDTQGFDPRLIPEDLLCVSQACAREHDLNFGSPLCTGGSDGRQ